MTGAMLTEPRGGCGGPHPAISRASSPRGLELLRAGGPLAKIMAATDISVSKLQVELRLEVCETVSRQTKISRRLGVRWSPILLMNGSNLPCQVQAGRTPGQGWTLLVLSCISLKKGEKKKEKKVKKENQTRHRSNSPAHGFTCTGSLEREGMRTRAEVVTSITGLAPQTSYQGQPASQRAVGVQHFSPPRAAASIG